MDYKEYLKNKEYDFLRIDSRFKDNIILLTVSGSRSYGTNIENSDFDIRGVVLESKSDTLGLTNFEVYEDKNTDTVIYSLKKFLKLLKECNPNIIELLYEDESNYIYLSDLGKKLISNRDMFLTKRAAYSFVGYANSQLNKLENGTARVALKDVNKNMHICRSIENVINSFGTKYSIGEDCVVPHLGSDGELLADVNVKNYPITKLKKLMDEINEVIRSYSKNVGARTTIKDSHLDKYMMHLIRLYYMCIEILKDKTLHVYRKDEHQLLMDIRNGKYRDESGNIKQAMFDMISSLRREVDELKNTTTLPDRVDEEKFVKFVLDIYNDIYLK